MTVPGMTNVATRMTVTTMTVTDMEARKREIETYATVTWAAGDVETLRPDWSLAKCEAFLQDNQKHLRDRTIEYGWRVMEDLLDFEEYEYEEEG
jgi:hypothetical protein